MRRALGKGLTQMLGETSDTPPTEVSVADIVANPRQPRQRFEDESLQELASSIKEHGLLQPLVVRALAGGRFELIAGERRLRAAKSIGLKVVPVLVRTASAQSSLEMALIENVQREDINPLDCARAYKRLSDEFGLTQEQVAARVGKSRVSVANSLRILRLPEAVQEAISEGVISEGHARALLMVDSPGRLMQLFERCVDEGLSVRELERMAKGAPRTPVGHKPESPHPEPDPDWMAVERRLSEHFGAKVNLARKGSGGRLSIDFYSEDELEGLLAKIGIRL